MFLVHEHCSATSAIDKYWLFPEEKAALGFFTTHVTQFKDSLDLEFYRELLEDEKTADRDTILAWVLRDIRTAGCCVFLVDGDYLVLARVDADGAARRP